LVILRGSSWGSNTCTTPREGFGDGESRAGPQVDVPTRARASSLSRPMRAAGGPGVGLGGFSRRRSAGRHLVPAHIPPAQVGPQRLRRCTPSVGPFQMSWRACGARRSVSSPAQLCRTMRPLYIRAYISGYAKDAVYKRFKMLYCLHRNGAS
jgi:hypothetical protein